MGAVYLIPKSKRAVDPKWLKTTVIYYTLNCIEVRTIFEAECKFLKYLTYK
jgi:hypothetical protein